MRRFNALLRHDLRELLHGGVFFFLAAALILCGLSFYVSLPASFFTSGSLPAVSVAMINSDDSEAGRTLFNVVRNLPEIESAVLCDAEEADRLLNAGTVSVIVEIPDGMVDSLIHNRPAEIRVRADDPLKGAAVYSMTSAAADTVNLMQTAVYAYRDVVRPLMPDAKRFRAAYREFCSDLIKDAILYRRFVDTASAGADPYQLQFLSLLVFLLCSGGALCVSLSAARQIAEGKLRRFFRCDLPFGCFFAAKFSACLLLSAALCAVLAILASRTGFAPAPLRLFAAAGLTTAAVAPVYICAAFLLPKPQYAALLSLALMLLFLFAGGGFYPVYVMNAALTAGNPAYLCVRLCAWALGDDFPARGLPAYCAPAICGVVVSLLLWNRERGRKRALRTAGDARVVRDGRGTGGC